MENMKNMSIYFSSGAEWSGRRISAESPGARFSKDPKTFRARKAIRETPTCLICKAGLFICCIAHKNQNNCKVSCLEAPNRFEDTKRIMSPELRPKSLYHGHEYPCSQGPQICTI